MFSYRKKVIFLILFGVLLANVVVYFVTQKVLNSRVESALKNHLNDLQTHYEILLYHQNIIAETAYEETMEKPGFIELFSKIRLSSNAEKAALRKELELLLSNEYKRLQKNGVLQYHFVLPDNKVFLRMHKLNKFGDDLSEVRKDFKYVNETKSRIRGFTQGRTAHGFRNIFPIFSPEGLHLGAIEISFSSDEFIKYLTNVSKIHTHFLVNKQIFDTNAWTRDDIILKYTKSHEHKDFMASTNDEHAKKFCYVGNKDLLEEHRDEIDAEIELGEKFSILLYKDNKAQAVSFLPVKSLEGTKTLAWFVSYVESDFIHMTQQSTWMIRAIALILSLIMAYLVYRIIMIQKARSFEIKKKAYMDGLTGVNNRNHFDEMFTHELLRNERYKRHLSMALLDIDLFKNFNDTYGHQIGDEVLIMLAQDINKKVRETDTFARWGGEEFVVLFPETTKEAAKVICEKLRKSVEELEHPTAGPITVSFGVTSYLQGDTVQTMFERCDDALYQAKENGRNRVCVI